ncbi:DHHC zinc finger domain containing protein [Tritrichomonas foetus]|uniref:Palmitoyltransferase n=1 Tax=Tritrichomonas foetus TaxID=1144522 RepID=A0A1J4K932_9EUKA|nr:DHHC zinc finger domain containing protein [Tritrichomonas foetus]|eukprot:OHT06220.1 DHHC zinc finger domain containing protein [Tritrichomonas foetus]
MEEIDDRPLNTIDQDEEVPDESIPEATKWKIVRHCCGIPVALVMPADRLFCRHWEIRLCIPIFVIFVINYCVVAFFVATFPILTPNHLKIVSPIVLTIEFVLFGWSYLSASFSDPGFLPYDWVRTKNTWYSWEDQLTGFALRPDQIQFAQNHHPPYASFSTLSGRYVIRADHFCGWITNWVGKRNHKQFILMNFYGFLFCSTLCVFKMFTSESLFKTNRNLFIVDVAATLFELSFAFTLFGFLCSNLWNMFLNRTQIQKWKNTTGKNTRRCNGCREVFGDGNPCLYCIPTHAFGKDLVFYE